MRYPDRQVRFEAAFAVAQALPQHPFSGQERVIPILAEALAQSGKAGVLVVASSDKMNAVKEQLKNYAVAGGPTADAAASAASTLTGVDVILMWEGDPQLDRMFADARDNIRIERAAKLIVVKSKVASPFAQMAERDMLITVTDASDEAGLNAAIEEARKRAGGLPLDEKMATAYAARSAELLQRLAISRGQVLDMLSAQPAVLAALDDSRPEIAKAASGVLAVLGSREAQTALATKAVDEKTAEDVKMYLLKDLSTNAKLFANLIEGSLVDSLSKLADTAANNGIKSAAAEALGSLNLRPEQVKTLILNQSAK